MLLGWNRGVEDIRRRCWGPGAWWWGWGICKDCRTPRSWMPSLDGNVLLALSITRRLLSSATQYVVKAYLRKDDGS